MSFITDLWQGVCEGAGGGDGKWGDGRGRGTQQMQRTSLKADVFHQQEARFSP